MSLERPIWPRFLPSTWVLNCATLGPIGRIRHAPGTWGSLAGLAVQLVLFHGLESVWKTLLVCLISVWFAVSICGEAEFRLGRRDPGEVVLDEFVAMPLCFLNWPALMIGPWSKAPIVVFLAGFALFRLFDITKPFGIRKLQDLPAGWGVVMDDIAAALLTCGALHAAVWAWRTWGAG